ncbi:MAG: acyltransferase domain-containing protein [Hydrogenophaga sp.]|uniref:type I polyketide synthase n=1 Tax=Hydrogenophaga sp. TaxID=1904254 RepID=UPI001DAAF903|nr:beta-ketoacyl synthase N-terminal-like domain-containing protein [Hydrogenophaga sp.]MBX3611470.1 acyltransferase domain-containing protein [Hydrogenophaga sp.]
MNDPLNAEALSPVKRALLEIRELKAQLARAQGAAHEPLAIVGMAMRLPGGVKDAAGLAELLWQGRDAIDVVPPDRWSLDELLSDDPDAPGRMTTRHGGFIDNVDRFDAEFFGISPREAASMDPQQRLLLEVAWEALEDAGQAPSSLAGSRTGVYLGISNNDYGRALFGHRELIDAYFSTGNAFSVASGRMSYVLGLQGPSVAVDTACSSSLVALHLACQGLRLGECDSALVGAVNLILTPEMNINFSRARMMAADGRCKTFDAAADGYVRGEGCVVLVVRRLRDAQARGDRVLAVIRGSAINQDGRSGGLTAPNGPAQEDVIRAALASARVSPGDIGYVEAHGTGTPLGDPIEVGALGAVLGSARDANHRLLIGSVKTNIGHLEAAAGLAGVAKVVLALQRGQIPPHLHFHQGNPHIDWSAWPLAVPTVTTPWEPINGRRLAGVSAFGFSGTNAHVVLEQAPADASPMKCEAPQPDTCVLALSARYEGALQELARRHRQALAAPGVSLADLCFTANAGRTHFAHRLAVRANNPARMIEGLQAYLDGRDDEAVLYGHADGPSSPSVAFLFTGQGAQYAGMGRALYERFPVFRASMDACNAALVQHLDRGLLELLYAADAQEAPIDDTAYAQPVTFAIEVSLAALWRSWGIEPVALLGHSLGEYAAACVAGAMSLEDGLRAVAARGRLTQALPADGAMAAVFASQAIVEEAVVAEGDALTIAAYNGPAHFVISGAREAVFAAQERLEKQGVRVKPLRVPHAAHSSLIEPALPGLREVMGTVHWSPPAVALVSNLTGDWVGPEQLADPDYWVQHMRQPVRFAQAMQVLLRQGITHFVEVGPHPVLLGMGAECAAGTTAQWLPSLHRERGGGEDMLEGLQRLYASGAVVDWAGFDSGQMRQRVAAPVYPFRAVRHWMDVVGEPPAATTGRSWSEISQLLDRVANSGPLDLDVRSYPAKWDRLRTITRAHAVHTLRAAGLFLRPGESHDLDDVLRCAGIDAGYRHLVSRWLQGLAGEGMLQRKGDQFVADAPLPQPDLEQLWADAAPMFADNQPLFDYVRHCGGLVEPVLRGRESPLETLFPGGSFELAENLYQRSATMRYINGLAAAAFDAMAATVPSGRRIRVLEIGGGTGGTSAAVLDALPPERTQYHFTDVSDVFLDRARERFAAHGCLSFGRFDMDADAGAQGYAPHSFDAIVAANAVHASKDLRAALQTLRGLLAPGGTVVLVESTTHLDWFDMTTGLIEGWQHFADDLRGDNPLLAPATWLQALREAGFEHAGAWPPAGSPAEVLGQHLIVARVPGEGGSGLAPAEAPSAQAADVPAARASAQELAAGFVQRLRDALPAEQEDLLREFVRERVVRVLRLGSDNPPGRHDRLMDLGFDSLMAVQLRNQLGTGLGLDKPLPATVMFDHPTIEALARYLRARVVPEGTATPATAVEPIAATTLPASPVLGEATVAAMSDADIEALLLARLDPKT